MDVYCACARAPVTKAPSEPPEARQNVAGRREHYSMGLVCLRCRFLPNIMSIASLCANEGCASSPTSGLQHGGSEV